MSLKHDTEDLEKATDLVAKVGPHADKLRPGAKDRADPMALKGLTPTSRYQPVRTICARPQASLRSLLLTCLLRAAFACRASRHTIGKPILRSACQRHVDNGPVSSPMRTASQPSARTVIAISSGVDRQDPRQRAFPSRSTTQICIEDLSHGLLVVRPANIP